MFRKTIFFLSLILCGSLYFTLAHADNAPVQQFRHTYSAYDIPITPAASATDVCSIAGSSTALIRVTRVELSNAQTTAGMNEWFLTKRSSLNLAGTSVVMTSVPHDSISSPATALVNYWTANPGTLGTAVGMIRGTSVVSPAPASSTTIGTYVWDFDQNNSQEDILLRGVNQQLGVNFNGHAIPAGMSVGCGFTWTEE